MPLTCRPTVVLDTSVLMASDTSLTAYPDTDIVIPLTVIDELDQNKKRDDEAGRHARAVLRTLEQARAGSDLARPADIGDGATVRVVINGVSEQMLTGHGLDPAIPDHRIIAAAATLADKCPGEVRLISNDAAMRIKAAVLGLDAAEHTPVAVIPDAGWNTVEIPYPDADLIRAAHGRAVPVDALQCADELRTVPVNTFLVARSGTASLLARRRNDGVAAVHADAHRAWGAVGAAKEQTFALNLLTDPDVPLVALDGPAGTGKTFLAIAAGLEQTFEADGPYARMTIVRPVISVGGQDLGFLPGDLAEKLGPWFECVVDTMVALSETGQTHREAVEVLKLWVEQGRLTLEPVTYLRGRSLQSTYLLVDEVQNLETSTVKTVITRLGAGSKGVLVGDTTQIDNPWTTTRSNGLTATIAAFTGDADFGHITLTAGQRSAIADKAARML